MPLLVNEPVPPTVSSTERAASGLVEVHGSAVLQGDGGGNAGSAALQRAAAERSRTRIGIGSRQGQEAAAKLGQSAAAVDRAGIGQRVGLIEDQRTAVADRGTGQPFAAATAADRERAAVDRGRTRAGSWDRSEPQSAPGLGQGAAAADHPRIGRHLQPD